MGVSTKNRKLLWGRSGNRCAKCRRELIVARTVADTEAVVGEECHIVSGAPGGPRHDPLAMVDGIDEYANLILLCRVHHKLVDDQPKTYTSDHLRQLKNSHEAWVSDRLDDSTLKPIRIRRVAGNVPCSLVRLTTGRALLDIIRDAKAYSFDNDEPRSAEEAEELAGFLQLVQDWGEVGIREAGEIVSVGFSLTERIKIIESLGFHVFGAREQQVIEGGVGPPSPWMVAIVRLIRK